MDPDTSIGGDRRQFPATRQSLVARVADADAGERTRAWDALVAAYWKPAYKHVRLQWKRSNEDAKDLTQAFFARAMEKDFFAGFDPGRARFRTFLRTCLDRFVANADAALATQKRGGGRVLIDLDFGGAEAELARTPAADPATDVFDLEWVRSIYAQAIDRLRAACAADGRKQVFSIFERYDLASDADGPRPTYEELGRLFGLDAITVTNRLAAARRDLRRIVLATIRESAANDDEYRDDVRAVLGIDPP